MSPFELSLSLVPGLVAAGGAWWWVRSHVHPEHVTRQELQPQLDLILSELRYLRERIDQRR